MKKFVYGMVILGFISLSGCAGMPRVNASKPVEHIVYVQADELWQDSEVYAKRGQLVQCIATGEWGDPDRTYGPDGNPNIYKGHFGVNAPAFSLLMRISSDMEKAYLVGSEASIRAERSGYVMFRNNVSLPQRATGQIQVSLRVASDADGDGVSDYDEVNVWGTDPLNPDTDGLGLGDYEKVRIMKEALERESEERTKPED